MSIFSLFIGKNKPNEIRKGKRTNAKGYVNKDNVIALELYNDNNRTVSYRMSRKSCILPYKTFHPIMTHLSNLKNKA